MSRVDSSDVFGNIQRAFQSLNYKLEKDVKQHLAQVYSTLSLALMASIAGAVVNYVFDLYSFRFLFTIAIFGFMIALITTSATRANEKTRVVYLFAMAFLTGCNLAPFISAFDVPPALIFNALMITFITFGCFSLSAIYADSTKFLHLGGILGSALFCLLITALFARSQFMFGVIMWGGLAINCGFILYDTQMICEKRRRGDTDYLWHTAELFIDFVNVFRYVLIILKEKDSNKRRRD